MGEQYWTIKVEQRGLRWNSRRDGLLPSLGEGIVIYGVGSAKFARRTNYPAARSEGAFTWLLAHALEREL